MNINRNFWKVYIRICISLFDLEYFKREIIFLKALFVNIELSDEKLFTRRPNTKVLNLIWGKRIDFKNSSDVKWKDDIIGVTDEMTSNKVVKVKLKVLLK